VIRQHVRGPLGVLAGLLLLFAVVAPVVMGVAARPPTADERATMPSDLDLAAGIGRSLDNSVCREEEFDLPAFDGYPFGPGFVGGKVCTAPDLALLVFARDAPAALSLLGWLLVLAAPVTGFALAWARGSPEAVNRRIGAGTGAVMLLGVAMSALLLGALYLAVRLRGVPGGERWDQLAGTTLRTAFLAGLCAVAGAVFGVLAKGVPKALAGLFYLPVLLLAVPAAILPVASGSYDEPDRPPLYRLYLWGRDELDAVSALLLLSLIAHLLPHIRTHHAVRPPAPAGDGP
jgi:hypothetical protein